ncbi:Protein PAL1 [Talaromyces islandicus]|uniref:Protein PAL1 n=1 Tax=Talaromyces islandicus TaxID=28573 RepID=A0A0U1LRH4_TALIS|nr:Protein PAL1 [Talaromyces islandicus]
MSLAPISVPERKPSPQFSVNLGSNNPFRNRTLSPGSPVSPGLASPGIRPERPRSTNPFLDDTEILSPQSAPAGTIKSPMSDNNPYTGNAAELFESLSLNSKPTDYEPKDIKPKERRPPPPRPDKPYSSSRSRPSGRPDGQGSRRDRSRDRNRSKDRSREKDPFDIFADPPDRKERPSRPREGRPRPRRNSESSIMEKPRRMDFEDDKRRRERRQRDGKSRSKRPQGYRLDLIDKLDVTSIYGTGLFHHDGPFDACNPHRNRKGSRQAPMQAFPKDSKNMAIGGAGPNNSNLDLAMIHGHTAESYLDYNSGTSKKGTAAFDSSARIDPVHGAESMGLGTSTFLEGTPASRSAIQRRQSETDNLPSQNGGLQRKKSLAQKIRGGINRPSTGRMVSPEPQRSPSSADATTSNRANERNPFFQDYDDAYESKGAKIEETYLSTRVRASSSPKRSVALQRETTNGSTGGDELKPSGGGFMNRMKSLRRPRPERRMPSE